MRWHVIAHRDHPLFENARTFAAAAEPVSVNVSERLIAGRIDHRVRSGGRLLYLESCALVFQGPAGFFVPIGTARVAMDSATSVAMRSLARRIGRFPRVQSMVGTQLDVDALGTALGVSARATVDYQLLVRSTADIPEPGPGPSPGLRVTRPAPDEWRHILPLQIAYEEEEVLLPGHKANPAASKAALIASLKSQRVLVAWDGDRAVARVATNARGFTTEQIGGVYTSPDHRRRGISRWLMGALLYELRSAGRHASLFVKNRNQAALGLYGSMGFKFVSPYRIRYYQ